MDLWPFVPDREFSESLEWMTGVLATPTTERRACVRTHPRHELSYSFLLSPEQYGAAKLLARKINVSGALIPLWGELHNVAGLSAGATAIAKDQYNPFYRTGDSVLVYESPTHYELGTVATVNPYSQINLVEGLASPFARASIVPVRVARVVDTLSAPRQEGAYVRASARFQIVDGDYFGTRATGLYLTDPVYKGSRVVLDRALARGSQRDGLIAKTGELDTEVGGVAITALADYVRETSSMTWKARGNQARWDLLYWLHSRHGRWKSFWLPSWNADLALASDIASDATTMTVATAGLYASTMPVDAVIFLRDGTHVFFRVTAAVPAGGGNETLTLEAPIGENVQQSQVLQMCLLRKVHFATDRVAIKRQANNTCYCSVQTEEIPS